ncbi:MAG: protein kinase [Saprospiraceae bacterium]|nr:protein kinase [Saprospiraceae bacterium]
MDKTIDQLLADGETKQALDKLGSLLKDLSLKYQEDWFSISARFHQLESERLRGLLPEGERHLDNKLNFDLLTLFKDCREIARHYVSPVYLAGGIEQNIEQSLETKLLGKYKVLKKVGEGATGLIFKGKDEFSGRIVAIKVLKVQTSDLKRAADEVEKVTRFKHRGIIKIFDVYFDSYPLCIITEFIDGINLDKLIRGSGPIPLGRTRDLICQLGDTLDYIRHRKVRHTTIRPSKIQIDEEGYPVLSPFEVIKSGRPDRNLEKVIQDCAYLSPEKLAPVDGADQYDAGAEERSDQFSMAVLAYEMLTGMRLFEGENIPEIINSRNSFFSNARFRQEKLGVLDEYPVMKKILAKMLQELPERRYEDLKSALRAIDAMPVVEKPWLLKVKDSYQRCLLSSGDFIAHFYENLFNALPEVKPLFNAHSDQHRMLQNAVLLLLETDSNRNFLERILQSTKHNGLKIQHYEVFIDQLIQTAAQHDAKWNEDLNKAWQKAMEPALKIIREYGFPQAAEQSESSS